MDRGFYFKVTEGLFSKMATRRGIFYFQPLDWNQTARVAREGKSGRNKAGGEPGGGGAIEDSPLGIEPTVHDLTNRKHWKREGATAVSPRITSAAEKEQGGCGARREGLLSWRR